MKFFSSVTLPGQRRKSRKKNDAVSSVKSAVVLPPSGKSVVMRVRSKMTASAKDAKVMQK